MVNPLVEIVSSAALLHLLRTLVPGAVPLLLAPFAYILVLLTLHGSLSFVDQALEARAAARLGAIPIPRQKTRLPWGIDLYLRNRKSFITDEPGTSLLRARDECGTVSRSDFLGQSQVTTFEPAHMQRILATNFQGYGKTDSFLEVMRDILGEGVFNSDQRGKWKLHRSMTRPHFARDEVFRMEHFEPHAKKLIDYFAAKAEKGEAVEGQEAFGMFTTDSGTDLFFGVNFDSLSTLSLPESDPSATRARTFVSAFLGAQDHGVLRLRRGDLLWRVMERIYGNANEGNMKVLHKELGQVVKDALDKPRTIDEETGKQKDTLLLHLVRETQDAKLITDELLNVLIAARDTTAWLLTAAVYELARRPECQKKLREEVIAAIGPDPAVVPTFEDLKDCAYLRAVLNETLRIWPSVFINSRMAFNEDTFDMPDGTKFYVPAKMQVRYPIGFIAQRTDLIGSDAGEWIPERWLDESFTKKINANAWMFQPFSGGPRICLGQKFALNEASFLLARLFQRIPSVELATDAQPADSVYPDGRVKAMSRLTLAFKGGMYVRFGKEKLATA